MADPKETLGDLGEFRLLNEVLLPELRRSSVVLGDDCGFVPIPETALSLVVTTDFAPRPLAWLLGETSYRTWGWYAVLINASDLAAAGAKSLGFTSSLEAPASMLVSELQDFCAGMADACGEYGLPYGGGNLRAAPRFECHGTAFGVVPSTETLRRTGCAPGDIFVSIGADCGFFIASYLHARLDGWTALTIEERTALIRPRPSLREMEFLRPLGVVAATSDNSDGVLGALWNIAERSACGVELDLNPSIISTSVRTIAQRTALVPWNLFFFWGDWQVIAAIRRERFNEFVDVAGDNAIRFQMLGTAIDGPTRLLGRTETELRSMRLLRNENFSRSSFNEGVESHVQYLLTEELFNSGEGQHE